MKKKIIILIFILCKNISLLGNDFDYTGIKILTFDYFLKIITIIFFISIVLIIFFNFFYKKMAKPEYEKIKLNYNKIIIDDKKIIDFEVDGKRYVVFVGNNFGIILDKVKVKKGFKK